MITSTNLITYGMPNMASYYSEIAQNFLDGKVTVSRKRFHALSQKQRKAFFVHLTDEFKCGTGDPLYDYFFEIF